MTDSSIGNAVRAFITQTLSGEASTQANRNRAVAAKLEQELTKQEAKNSGEISINTTQELKRKIRLQDECIKDKWELYP